MNNRHPGTRAGPSWLRIADLSRKARMIDNARGLADSLKSAPIDVEFRVAPGETHATGNWPAMREALQLAFDNTPCPLARNRAGESNSISAASR